MWSEFIKFKVHKVIKIGLALYCTNFINFQLTLAQSWAPVGSGITGPDANTTWSFCSYDSVLYAGGWFTTAGGTAANSLAQWNGTTWDSVGSTNGFINAMAVYNGNLYAGGAFNAMGGVAASDIARWNGSAWSAVGVGLKGGDYGVNAMVVFNGSLYVAGSFDSSGTLATHYIARWNDTNWYAVGPSISMVDEDDGIFTLAVYAGELYMGGDFVVAGGTNFAMWDGSAMSSPGGGTVGYIYSLAVYKNKLYAGGNIFQAGAIEANAIATWDGANWTSPDSGIWGENGWAVVTALTVYNGELYAGGYFDSVKYAQLNCIAKWNGAQWLGVGSGINQGGSVDAMTVFNNSLYVGGGFDSAGGVYAENIAMFSTPSSINKISENGDMAVYPNPNDGIFTIRWSVARNQWPACVAEATIAIYTVLGEKVYSQLTNHNSLFTIDLSNQPAGIYFISVCDGDRQFNTKIIKN